MEKGREEIPEDLPADKIADFLNTQLIRELSATLIKGRNEYFILEDIIPNGNGNATSGRNILMH